MLHLIKYNLLIKLRNFNMVFWPLVFPLIMATFFFFAFGNLNDADFETVQVALVKESANPVFVFFLDQVQSGDSELIALHEMSEKDALDALSQKKISGIYYEQAIPGLTLNGQGIPESILQSVLESYENNLHTLQTILKKHPSGLLSALRQMSDTKDLVQEVSLGGKTIDGNSQFFLRSGRNGMSLWMFYRLWLCDHFTGQFNGSGGTSLHHAYPQAETDPFRTDCLFSAGVRRCNRSASVSAKYPEPGFSGTVRQNVDYFSVRKPDRCIYGIVYRKS